MQDDKAHDFMLAEYQTMRDLRAGLISLGENRVNYFLVFVSGAIALVGLGLVERFSEATLNLVVTALLAGLFLLGLLTFARMVERSIRITSYSRGMNRIRRYFVEQHPHIDKYLILPTDDAQPPFRESRGGLPMTVAFMDSALAGAFVLFVMRSLDDMPIGKAATVGIIAVTAVVIFFGQNTYMRRRFAKAEEQTKPQFPKEHRRETSG